jgi:hypothetical protein
MKRQILNSKGQPIVLNDMELKIANNLQAELVKNALGYEIDITTLTTIMKKITEQKFFEIAPADYLPLRVGEGAWSMELTTYRSFKVAGDFSEGIMNTGANNVRLASADAGVDSLTVKVRNWAKSIGWSLMELQLASKAGNWDVVTAKEKARKRNWDLGIQKVAFLGLDSEVLGLYNQTGVTVDATRLVQPISELSPVDLKDFCAKVLDDYRSNCARTAWPTHFIIPESDYLGLAAPSSADFPLKSVLQVMEETFQTMTKNKGFKILPCAYGDKAYSGQVYQQYVMLNYEEESLRMDIPVDYTNTLANSLDNFSFQNVGYGQFTGVLAYRPLEMYYYRFTPIA